VVWCANRHFQQHDDGLLNVAFIHQQPVADTLTHDGLRQLAGRAHGNALGNRGLALRMAVASHGVDHGRKALHLHPHDLDGRTQGLCSHRHPGNQPSPACGHHQHVEVGLVLQHLQPHRALTGRDIRIVIRVDKGQAPLVRERRRSGFHGLTTRSTSAP